MTRTAVCVLATTTATSNSLTWETCLSGGKPTLKTGWGEHKKTCSNKWVLMLNTSGEHFPFDFLKSDSVAPRQEHDDHFWRKGEQSDSVSAESSPHINTRVSIRTNRVNIHLFSLALLPDWIVDTHWDRFGDRLKWLPCPWNHRGSLYASYPHTPFTKHCIGFKRQVKARHVHLYRESALQNKH